MGQTPETGLVKAIRKAVLAEWPDAYILKVHGSPYQPAGTPDLLLTVEGWFIGLEVKCQRPGESREHALGRVSVSQQGHLDAIRKAGGWAQAVLTVEEALYVVRQAIGVAA